MNRIYRLIWNAAQGKWQVAPETARGGRSGSPAAVRRAGRLGAAAMAGVLAAMLAGTPAHGQAAPILGVDGGDGGAGGDVTSAGAGSSRTTGDSANDGGVADPSGQTAGQQGQGAAGSGGLGGNGVMTGGDGGGGGGLQDHGVGGG
uniref:ESPR domain-containing protein n=1 Tax=Bordetella sputigena TaxID=1416810 RepID=UPI0039EFA8D6